MDLEGGGDIMKIPSNKNNNTNTISWKKNKNWTAFPTILAVLGLVLYIIIALVLLKPFTTTGVIVIIIGGGIIACAPFISVKRKIPLYVGISKEGVHLKFKQKEETIKWADIIRIYKVDSVLETRYVIFLNGGEIKYLSFISRKIIDLIFNKVEIMKSQKTLQIPDAGEVSWQTNVKHNTILAIWVTTLILMSILFAMLVMITYLSVPFKKTVIGIVVYFVALCGLTFTSCKVIPIRIGFSKLGIHFKYKIQKYEEVIPWEGINKVVSPKVFSFRRCILKKDGTRKEMIFICKHIADQIHNHSLVHKAG